MKSTDQERAEFIKWAIDALEANTEECLLFKDEFTDQSTNAAWFAWQAARCSPSVPQLPEAATAVPQGYECGMMTDNRVTLVFDTQASAETWFEQFCDNYDEAVHQPLGINNHTNNSTN